MIEGATVVTVMLLMENGFETEMIAVLQEYEENVHICCSAGNLILDVLRYRNPFKRIVKNQAFVQAVKSVENPNSEVIDIFSRIVHVLDNGFESLTKNASNEQVFIDRFGPIPNRPPPPLPIGCSMYSYLLNKQTNCIDSVQLHIVEVLPKRKPGQSYHASLPIEVRIQGAISGMY